MYINIKNKYKKNLYLYKKNKNIKMVDKLYYIV